MPTPSAVVQVGMNRQRVGTAYPYDSNRLKAGDPGGITSHCRHACLPIPYTYSVFKADISPRSSPINSAMARLDVKFSVLTPVTNNSTCPDDGSNTFIMSDPSGFEVQMQERGRKPHSMMWRSSRMEIMTHVLKVKGGLSFCLVKIDSLLQAHLGCDQLHQRIS